VRHVPHQARRRGNGPRIVFLRAPRARTHEDPVLLPEDRRRPPGRGGTAPEAPFLKESSGISDEASDARGDNAVSCRSNAVRALPWPAQRIQGEASKGPVTSAAPSDV